MMTHRLLEFRQHWQALVGCMIGASIGTIGFYAYTSGAFVTPLIQAGYTKSQLSFAALLLNGVIAVTAPIAGVLMDRNGALRVIAFCVIGEAVGFALLGWTPVNFPYFAGGVMLLALLGVGTTPPGFARIITARFDRARGLALGIMISGPGIMAMTAPIWMTWVIRSAGWRAGYWSMAALVLILGGLSVALLRRDEQGGERDDVAERLNRSRGSSSGNWAALRRPAFWLLLIAFIAPALFGGGYLFHMITLLQERGFSPEGAARVQSLIGFAIVVGRLSSGAAVDRFPPQRVAAVVFIISALGCVLMLTTNPLLMGVAALAIGLTIGAELDILAYLIGRYFGLDSFGRLYGLAYACLMIGSGASPLLIASVADARGYDVALIFSTIGTLIGPVILLVMPAAPRADDHTSPQSPVPPTS